MRWLRLLHMFFNISLLVAGSALFGFAFDFYALGKHNADKGLPQSIDLAKNYYSESMAFVALGTIPLLFGIRGEVKRMSVKTPE